MTKKQINTKLGTLHRRWKEVENAYFKNALQMGFDDPCRGRYLAISQTFRDCVQDLKKLLKEIQ